MGSEYRVPHSIQNHPLRPAFNASMQFRHSLIPCTLAMIIIGAQEHVSKHDRHHHNDDVIKRKGRGQYLRELGHSINGGEHCPP